MDLSKALGGETPSIVLPDADLDAAVTGCLQGALLNSGQVCAAYTRFYVHRSLADEFAERCAKAVPQMRLGRGSAEDTDLGPVATGEHQAHVDVLVRSGIDEGASLLTGGSSVDRPGYFYRPTVFAGVHDDMRIAREEIFGSVLSILAYDEETRRSPAPTTPSTDLPPRCGPGT
jgi:acyl-CoA reductase-like NAD-dependent aldehyde dehydrogenase